MKYRVRWYSRGKWEALKPNGERIGLYRTWRHAYLTALYYSSLRMLP